jgi:hypothetical protein
MRPNMPLVFCLAQNHLIDMTKPRILTLALKGIYFDEIKAGLKTEEYRLITPYWSKRLEGCDYDQILLTRGYPKRSDEERRLLRAWSGYTRKTLTHPHFGADPVDVFAIDVSLPSFL